MISAELESELAKLITQQNLTEIVLFSDISGRRLALLPIGLTQRHQNIDELTDVKIDGLRALCATRITDLPAPLKN
jgi:hypothetical protein